MESSTYRIVVGYDYSETADLALEKAFDLASREENGEVHAVTVVVEMGDFVPAGIAGVVTSPTALVSDAYDALESRVLERMSAWQNKSERSFSRLVVHVRTEVPAAEVAQLAADLEADLVVVGTHGRRGVRRLLLGSVAEGVVRLAPCPVLVVRPREPEADVPKIEPPCPQCVEARRASGGAELWCEQHRERHGQRHVYRRQDRLSTPANPPFFYGLR